MSDFSSEITSDDKLWAALAYVFAPIVGIIILLMEDKKARPFLKFHGVQLPPSLHSSLFPLYFGWSRSVSAGCACPCCGWFSYTGRTRPTRASM